MVNKYEAGKEVYGPKQEYHDFECGFINKVFFGGYCNKRCSCLNYNVMTCFGVYKVIKK